MWFVGARVFTGEGDGPRELAFRVLDGRFTAVVAPAEAAPEAGEDVVDLAGATVLPGLLDVHTHPAFMSQLVDAVTLLPPAVSSLAEMLDALRRSPVLGQGPDAWIEAFGYDDSAWPEGRPPTRHDLDQVTTEQPMFVRRCDGHSGVANTRALEIAGITAETPDPPHAAYGREADGTPDGRLIEPAATDSIANLVPNVTQEERVARVVRLAEHFASHGIVGVGDMLATMVPEPLATFRAAAQRCDLPRIGLYLGWEQIKQDPPTLTDDERTGRVFIAGVKLFMDGAYSNRTAWTHDEYPHTCDHGMRTATDDDLRAAFAWARANRVQVSVHAMGDAALDHALDLFEHEEPWLNGTPSLRLEHATLFSPERVRRVAASPLGIAVVSHTIFFFAEYAAYESNLSPEQFQIAYPIRSFYEGVPATALASDTPATAWADADDVFTSLQAAVVRRSHTGADIGQAEAVTVAQGLELYTSRAARCMRMDGLGRIAEGYEASFVVLDRDVFTIAPETIAEVQVAQTWLAGKQVFPARG